MIRLFHFTDEEAATAILSDGFRKGERGDPWFSRELRTMGETARTVLLEVWLDATEDEVEQFRASVDEEVLDDDFGNFVPIADPKEFEEFEWYTIPAETVNARGEGSTGTR